MALITSSVGVATYRLIAEELDRFHDLPIRYAGDMAQVRTGDDIQYTDFINAAMQWAIRVRARSGCVISIDDVNEWSSYLASNDSLDALLDDALVEGVKDVAEDMGRKIGWGQWTRQIMDAMVNWFRYEKLTRTGCPIYPEDIRQWDMDKFPSR